MVQEETYTGSDVEPYGVVPAVWEDAVAHENLTPHTDLAEPEPAAALAETAPAEELAAPEPAAPEVEAAPKRLRVVERSPGQHGGGADGGAG